MAALFEARFFFPGARSVSIETECATYQLESADGRCWFGQVQMPGTECLYRYRVDGYLTLPDPFNSLYHHENGRYHSLWHPGFAPTEFFPEGVSSLAFAGGIPTTLSRGRSAVPTFGPGDNNITAIASVFNLHRRENHVAWIWRSSSQRLFSYDCVITGDTTAVFTRLAYEMVPEFGEWSLGLWLNGRWSGEIACQIRPLGYPTGFCHTWGRTSSCVSLQQREG